MAKQIALKAGGSMFVGVCVACAAGPPRVEPSAAPDPAAEPQSPSELGRGSAPGGIATAPEPAPAANHTDTGNPAAASPADELHSLSLPAGSKVLHVGDSFAGALGLPLGELLEAQGVHSVLKHTDASYLTDWAWDGNLQKYIWKYNPDLVIVTLGANELGIAQPEQRERTIKKIVSVVGERPCLWVAVPLWKGRQNGLMDVIQRNVAPCEFFDTNRALDVEAMPRISDGIHPTTSARMHWAGIVLDWLKRHRAPSDNQVWRLIP